MSPESPPSIGKGRLILLVGILVIGFTVISGQLVNYQVVKYQELREIAEQQRIEKIDVPPPRGIIYDSHGLRLAMNTVQWDVSVSPSLVVDTATLADELAVRLDLPREEVAGKLEQELPWVHLKQFVPHEVGEGLLDLQARGLICDSRPKRNYPHGGLYSHTLGIVTSVGDGFYGVEGYYNQILKGSAGQQQRERDSTGSPLPLPPEEESVPKLGTSLILTLDSNIQHIAQQELVRALQDYGARSGTVIVMDPKTGAILANASYPAYNPNDFVGTDLKLLADPAVSSMWEPGSIFKIITWAAGLDTGTISPGTTFYDDGSMEVGGRAIRNWDRQGHGLVTMTDGLVESLNTVASFISTSMGKDHFYNYLRRFGLGSLTDVDLASEGPGMMKLPGDSNWFPSELGTNSFGQGIAVTPIQMISAASVVANRGLLMKPHVLHQYIRNEGEGQERVVTLEPTIVRRTITEETAATLTQMLVQVVEHGAVKAQVPGYRIAGKTGTAQIPTAYGYHPSDTVASFIGYAPADDPKFIVLVKLDKPSASPWGSQTAAPTFKAIAEKLFVYMHIPPDDIRVAQQFVEP